MKLTAYGVIRQGKVSLDDVRSYTQDVRQFGEGEAVVLSVESEEEHRTNAQNRFFHGPILKAFMTLGYHQQEAKDMLALRLIPNEITLLNGSVVRVPGHTSALSKEAFTRFIDACIQLAAEQGLVIKDVDEWRAQQQGQVA